jgi:hypothetical protein
MTLCEQALAEAPDAMFRVEALGTLAALADSSGQKASRAEENLQR